MPIAPKVRIANNGAAAALPSFTMDNLPVGFVLCDTAGQNWQLAASTAPVDHTTVEAVAGNPNLRWRACAGIGTPGYTASNYGITPSNPDNGPALLALRQTIAATGRGGRVCFDGGDYKFKTVQTFTNESRIDFMGAGRGVTLLSCDDSAGNIGDLFTYSTGARYIGFRDLTLNAEAPRTAGRFVRVIGDMLISDAVPLQNITFENVDMLNGYVGVRLEDNGSKGVCGFTWDGRSVSHGFGAGGTVFEIATKNGTVNVFKNHTHSETSGVAGGSRPYATMHISGAGDLRLADVESVYAQNGCVIDPPASGRVNTVWMSDCIWGSASTNAFLISPNATAECSAIKIHNGWVDGDGLTVVGAAVQGLEVIGMAANGGTGAVKLNGVTGGAYINMTSYASVLGFYATGNSANFQVDINFAKLSGNQGTAGWQVDSGCSNFGIRARNCRTTGANAPLSTSAGTDNSGAVTKTIDSF